MPTGLCRLFCCGISYYAYMKSTLNGSFFFALKIFACFQALKPTYCLKKKLFLFHVIRISHTDFTSYPHG